MHCRFAERPAVGGCGLSQLNSRRRVLPKPLILFTPMPEQADCSLIGTAPRPRATLRLVTRMLGLGLLSALADSGRKSSTIGRRAAAIGYHHKMAGHEPPTNQEGVRAVLRGIRRTIGTARAGKAPATADLIGQMVALCPDTMIGRRDRALLAFGFAGAFRRSELCALDVADLTETPDGLRVLIRRSNGDQEGQGQEVAIPRGYRLRPVEAVQTWLAAAEISAGPVFRAVALGGKVGTAALSPFA